MNTGHISIQQFTQAMAWTLSAMITLLAPATFFLVSCEHLRSELHVQTELSANDLSAMISSNTQLWRYEELRLSELLRRRSNSVVAESRILYDIGGEVIARNRQQVSIPRITDVHDIFDAGTAVARIEASRSLTPLLLRTFAVALCSAIIAAVVFYMLRTLPLRATSRAYQALDESESKYRLLYESMREGMALHHMDFDENGDFAAISVIDANPSCAAMFGCDPQTLIGSDSIALFGETFREYLSELLRLLEQGTSIQFELTLPRTDNLYSVHAFSPDHGLVATLFEDITERRKSEQQIQHMAYFDSLTDLPNRVLFLDRLRQAIAHALRDENSLAVLFLDLDRFKDINDTLGHSAGDQLLIQVTRRLGRQIRSCDTLARLGGDEFVVIVTDLGKKMNATRVAQDLINAIQPPFLIAGRELHVTTSIGIALFPDDGNNAETLVKHADLAMYSSKESGRNRYNFYSASMNQKALMRMETEAGLRNALERREFYVEFQPIMNAADSTVVAAEALVRWNHPTRGRIPPDQFIDLAEETGLVVPLGEWVLRTVCSRIKTWSDAGLPLIRFSVNVSSRQIERQDFAEIVRNALRESGANSAQLEIELTESCLIRHSDTNISDLFGLKEWGVSFAIDDFGTGYSSLGYIKTLPIDHIKIDRSFVRDISTDFHDQAIVEAIIAMSQRLGIRNIAEGVETIEQVRFLQERGCEEIQGYYFHRPLSAEALEELLRAQEN
ncbi:diguanylate cyclase/phosphodiesterase [Pelobacter propionicus DSM 2379]|uniref:Diguanylate cyclase/phosphodiesterase n=2 Tax=Pelobacter propionicus TaxID=29543 RepID=A1AUR6_PELPD|nr:diguanylate cyclase/phosphodiesterase [Pelobacter propionicus DSM 2379]